VVVAVGGITGVVAGSIDEVWRRKAALHHAAAGAKA